MKSNNSIFSINKTRKLKLKELIMTLFPTIYFKIKSNGMILIGDKFLFIPIVKERVHVSEFCLTHLPNSLSRYRQGNTRYTEVYNRYLEYIIHTRSCNVIDYLYSEFLRIKSSSKVDILLEDAPLFLPEPKPGSITIGKIIKINTVTKSDVTCKLKETISLLNRYSKVKEPVKDQFNRLSFILGFKK